MELKNLNELAPSLSFQPPPTSTISLDASQTRLSKNVTFPHICLCKFPSFCLEYYFFLFV